MCSQQEAELYKKEVSGLETVFDLAIVPATKIKSARLFGLAVLKPLRPQLEYLSTFVSMV